MRSCRKCESWSDQEFKQELRQSRAKVKRLGDRWAEGVESAMPSVVEAARRSLRLRAYPTQIMGALGIGAGSLVEMATGEGKTLTIALAAATAGWSGKPCHVITANDYLAQRDASEFGRFYKLCGLKVASISAEMTPSNGCTPIKQTFTARVRRLSLTTCEIKSHLVPIRTRTGELCYFCSGGTIQGKVPFSVD